MSNKITVSAQVICYLNGSPLGQVNSFHWSSSTPYKALYGLDSIVPVELAATTTNVSGTVGIYSIPGSGNLGGLGVTAPFQNVLNQQYFTIALRDEQTGTTFFSAQYCQVQDQSWQAESKGIVSGSFSFTGLLWTNEVPVAVV